MSPKSMTEDQFLDVLAQTFRQRTQAFLGTPVTSWTEENVATIFHALNSIPGAPVATSPDGGDQIGTCTYTVDKKTFAIQLTRAQCNGIPGAKFT